MLTGLFTLIKSLVLMMICRSAAFFNLKKKILCWNYLTVEQFIYASMLSCGKAILLNAPPVLNFDKFYLRLLFFLIHFSFIMSCILAGFTV